MISAQFFFVCIEIRHITEKKNQYTVWNFIICLSAQLRGQIASLNVIDFFLERLLTSENSSVSLTTSVKQFKCIVIIIIIMLNFKIESGITK